MHGRTQSRLRIGLTLLLGASLLQTSCGTVLYPERCGQPRGRLDLGVVALDGIGLVLFLVPGIVAFAVDFSTGAIYLPPEQSHTGPILGRAPREVRVEPNALTAGQVETIVRERTGKEIALQPGSYQARPLRRLEDFTPATVAELEAEAPGRAVVFRANDR